MGKAARRNAQLKMEAGILPIRIGRKERAKDRKRREKQREVMIPVPRGEKPLQAMEVRDVFERTRQAKAEVEAGIIPPERVDLSEVGQPVVDPETAKKIAFLVLASSNSGRRLLPKEKEGEALEPFVDVDP